MHRLLRSARSLLRFLRLERNEDRWLILETAFFLLCAKIATFTTSTRTLLALGSLEQSSLDTGPQVVTLPDEVIPAIHALDKSSRRLTFANCLTRAIALRMLLARRDIPTQIHIGARKDEKGEFAAHAWLTYNEVILVGGNDARDLYREIVGSHHELLR